MLKWLTIVCRRVSASCADVTQTAAGRRVKRQLMVKLAEPGKTWSRWITPVLLGQKLRVPDGLYRSAPSQRHINRHNQIVLHSNMQSPPCSFAVSHINILYADNCVIQVAKAVSRQAQSVKKG